MANTLLTPSVIGREALMILENNLVATGLFHRGHTEEFTGAKVGDTITIRAPASFTAQEYAGSIVIQNATEVGVPMVLEKHFDVSFPVTSKEWTLKLNDFSKQLLEPAVVAIAQGLDNYIMSKVKLLETTVGAAGDPPDSLADLLAVDKILNDQKVPIAGRVAIIDSQAKADMLAIENVINAEQRSDGGQAIRDASLGKILGFGWFMSQNVNTFTSLPDGNYVVDNGAGYAIGATTMVIDTGAGAPAEGDIFVVAGDTVQHRVTSGSTTLVTFTPALAGAVVDNAALTFVATHQLNFAGHPNAITAAIVPLALPRGAANAAYIGDRGMGLRIVYDYDNDAKQDVISIDVLAGAQVQHPELGVRVLG